MAGLPTPHIIKHFVTQFISFEKERLLMNSLLRGLLGSKSEGLMSIEPFSRKGMMEGISHSTLLKYSQIRSSRLVLLGGDFMTSVRLSSSRIDGGDGSSTMSLCSPITCSVGNNLLSMVTNVVDSVRSVAVGPAVVGVMTVILVLMSALVTNGRNVGEGEIKRLEEAFRGDIVAADAMAMSVKMMRKLKSFDAQCLLENGR